MNHRKQYVVVLFPCWQLKHTLCSNRNSLAKLLSNGIADQALESQLLCIMFCSPTFVTCDSSKSQLNHRRQYRIHCKPHLVSSVKWMILIYIQFFKMFNHIFKLALKFSTYHTGEQCFSNALIGCFGSDYQALFTSERSKRQNRASKF